MAWFKKARKKIAPPTEKPSRVPEGLMVKCPGCAQILYNKDLTTNLNVCPKCAHHFRMNASERLRMLFDDAWVEYDRGLVSTDPLSFTDTKPYKSRLKAGIAATGLKDAVIAASGTIDGVRTMVAAMEYGFIGGSMGVVVGEKIARTIERAIDARAPVVIVCCSGGARMMEGALSLMQMAKICGGLARLDRARLPYISVLTDPDHRWRDRQLRDARGPEHRRAARRSSALPARASSNRRSGRNCPKAFSEASSCSRRGCWISSSIGGTCDRSSPTRCASWARRAASPYLSSAIRRPARSPPSAALAAP